MNTHLPNDSGAAYSERIDEALRLAATAHCGQDRKGTQIPYVMHPVHVARLLERHGCTEEVIIAGLLHDVLEDPDYDDTSLQQRLVAVFPALGPTGVLGEVFRSNMVRLIDSRFGSHVAHLVSHASEQKVDEVGQDRPWKVRKLEQVAVIENGSREGLAVKAADCLHNLHSMRRDVEEHGAATMQRFKGGASGALWFNAQASARIAAGLGEENSLARELVHALWAFEATLQQAAAVPSRRRHDPFTVGPDVKHSAASPGPLWCIGSGGRRIHGFGHWFHAAPPRKGLKHWRDGRSAKEIARAWTRAGEPSLPEELLSALSSHSDLETFRCATALPEHETRLPGPAGEGRHHDLLALGMAGDQRIVVGIEAKADEPFGPTVGDYLDDREQFNQLRLGSGSPENSPRLSRVPERIRALRRYVFRRELDEPLRSVRYQLLHAVAGTMREAEQREADVAVFVVHEFLGPSCAEENVARNGTDFAVFLQQLGCDWTGSVTALVGPIPVMAGDRRLRLFVGKIRTELRGSGGS
jgi:HD domain